MVPNVLPSPEPWLPGLTFSNCSHTGHGGRCGAILRPAYPIFPGSQGQEVEGWSLSTHLRTACFCWPPQAGSWGPPRQAPQCIFLPRSPDLEAMRILTPAVVRGLLPALSPSAYRCFPSLPSVKPLFSYILIISFFKKKCLFL